MYAGVPTIKAEAQSAFRELVRVLDTVEALLFNCGNDRTVLNESRRAIMGETVPEFIYVLVDEIESATDS